MEQFWPFSPQTCLSPPTLLSELFHRPLRLFLLLCEACFLSELYFIWYLLLRLQVHRPFLLHCLIGCELSCQVYFPFQVFFHHNAGRFPISCFSAPCFGLPHILEHTAHALNGCFRVLFCSCYHLCLCFLLPAMGHMSYFIWLIILNISHWAL